MRSEPERPDPAAYLLGLSDEADASDPEFAAAAARWADRLAPLDDGAEAAVPPELWQAISDRLDTPPGLWTVRQSEGVWERLAPGIERKVVRADSSKGTAAYFLRLAAGTILPEHDHPAEEHCVLLQGRLSIGPEVFEAGSYQFAQRGRPHPPVLADTASLVFIHGPL